RSNALTRFGRVRARTELLDVAVECRGGAGLLGVGPGLVIGVLAGLLIERGKPLARLGHVRARAEVLRICSDCRRRTGAHRVRPSLSSASLRPSSPTRWRASATCTPPPKFWM